MLQILPLALSLLAAAPHVPPGAGGGGAAGAGVAASSRVAAYRETVQRILAAAVEQGRAYELLGELCRVAPGRLSGTPAAERAVDWAERTMKELGLENVRREECLVPRWVRGEVERLAVVAPAGAAGTPLPILALGGSVATPPGGITAEVIAVHSFDELRERAEEARGRIVLFNEPMRPEGIDTMAAYGVAVQQRVHGASRAAEVGAVAALVRSVSTRLDDFPHTGTQTYAEGVPRIPTAAVSTLGADRIAALLAASRPGEPVVLKLELDCRQLADVPSHNVVGELRGRELPEEIVVVGGHLDSWDVGEGAHDDGGGCCQAIEVARLLRALELRPRRTIRVVLFMNEENGLRGAEAYYAAHLDELPRHVLAIESDRGVMSPRGFTTDANPEALALLREIAAFFDEVGAGIMRPGGGGADIGPLRRKGVITVGYLPDVLRYFDMHHSARDTFEQVSPLEIELGAGLITALAYVVADLPEALPRNPDQE